MNIIRKLPGPFLIFLGACSLSFGGLIVKSFEGATLWQILFWRTVFFLIVISLYLALTYKKQVFRSFYNLGFPGFFGGFILSLLAIFGYFFLKEKISAITLTSIILAISGILLMVGSSLSPGQMSGNIAAFIMPISFATLILVVRKYPTVDMVPAQFVAGVFALLIGFLMSEKIMISPNDIFLGFLAGFLQLGLGFIFITIGAQRTPSAMVGIIMLTEAVLGPLWAWLFINEQPPFIVIIGGSIVIFAVLLQFYNLYTSEKKAI